MKLKLTPEQREYFRAQGRKGGQRSAAARLKKLSPQQRSEIARRAVAAREAQRKQRGWRAMQGMARGPAKLTQALEAEHRAELARDDARPKGR